MKKNISSYLLLLPLAILFACEGNTTYEKTIVNNTGRTLKVLFHADYNYPDDTVIVDPLGVETFIITDQLGGNPNPESCMEGLDSAYVWVSSGGYLTKDITDISNWELISDQRKKVPSDWKHSCIFSVNEIDIQ